MNQDNGNMTAARKVYETYWESYQDGDLETFASTLDDRFELIGTSETEFCHSKADGIEFLKAQLQEIVNKVEMRNRQINLLPVENLMLVNEQCDIYVLLDSEWNFYSKIRISTLLRETKEGWKVAQQHGSLPDMRVGEGETIALEKISKENLELRDAVKRRTAELENKNRELAIESSLEKVRAVAMGMKKPEDMLDVCRVISDQLQDFGVGKIRNVQIAIIDENIGQYLCYQYFTPYEKTTVEITEYLKSPVEHGMVKQMLASRDGYFIGGLSAGELEEFRAHRKEENHFPDPFLDRAEELTYCFLSIGEGGLGLTLYQPMAEDILKLFKRFHQVFSLAYQRFRDIQKAEAQAREAQIEVAVERVRAQSMAMHHPDDLDKVNKEILTQLNWLQIQGLSGVTFYLVDQNGWVKAWDFSSPGNIGNQNSYTLQFDFKRYEMMGYPFKILQETDLNYFIADYPFEKLEKAVSEIEEINPEVANAFKEALAKGILTHQWSACARITDGLLGVDLVSPPSEDTKTIVLKIAGAFNQAYQRFLDLQKAEALAREAQIEAALERVRAQTMAMHSSEDVGKCIVKMFGELTALGVDEGTRFGIGILNHDNENIQLWTASKDGEEVKMHIGYLDMSWHPLLKSARKAWKAQVSLHQYILEGEDLVDYYQMINDAPDYKLQIDLEKLPEREFHYGFVFEHGFFYAFNPREFQPDLIHITKRFSALFEQTYRRYLDLVKAEAQAREAQIQLALERVRARTMAMQHSDELAEASSLLFEQMKALGVNTYSSGFTIWDKEQGDLISWMCNADGSMNPPFRMPFADNEWHHDQYNSWKNGEDFAFKDFTDKEMQSYFRYLRSFLLLDEAFKKSVAAGHPMPERQVHNVANFSHGNLLFITLEPVPEVHDIFMRFAKVFEQTYTRFLDLKKAEAQAREAEIQLALERVRARSLAMHRSEELADISLELVKQVQTLGMECWFCAFNIYEDDPRGSVEWGSNGQGTFPKYRTPREGVFLRYFEAGQRGETFLVNEIGEEECPAHYEYLCSLPGVGEQLLQMKAAGIPFPTSQIDHVAFFKYGYVLFITYEPAHESHGIFKRFANVFEQTYTRFLDLQKAEAQTREAKIEAALEKVRSRTMGMQSSDELPEVANLLFLEVQALGIPAWSCGYNILSDNRRSSICIMSSEGTMQKPFALPLTGEASFNEWHRFIQSGETFFTQELGGKAIENHYNFMKSLPQLEPIFKDIEDAGLSLPTYQINHLCKFTYGFLLFITYEKVPESHDIFKRFTTVFDQTYTRFLDLKKAEAQAREAQIENALEKVRSRSLAMQSPDELIDVARLLREEMGALGVEELETSSIYIHDENNGTTKCWFTIKNPNNPGKAVTDQMTIDLQDTWVGRKMDEFFLSKAKQTSILMQGEERIEWIRYCEEKSDLFGNSNFYGETIPDRTYHLYKFSNGYIGAAAPGEISSESWELLKRATAVFSFAYTRFRDLQLAEASARAAMRQASLDRVRADISSMRNAEDLDRVTPLFFHELTTLGIPFIRCGVFIIQEKQEIVEAYLSSPDGNSLGVLRLPYQASELTYQTVEAWRKGVVYRQHWNKEDFIQWINQLMEQDQIQESSTYQGTAAPPESLDLHFVPFTQGMLYVGAENPLDEKELELVQALAKAFSIAYARYEDFVKLEQAKAEVESAMTELKATQSQLIQQEKLASLGQLTAGIAHEIKNPLNFVNNFSEVSIEMIEEALEELEKRDLPAGQAGARDETLIRDNLEDIKSNLQKVHEHGSRANSIVTSMLQHSRGGSGSKEPTDLNALIKEYVNLSYHGMRAGKNAIDVDISLDLDPNIGEVSLIKEDFSRVVINLCNNAFDACAERSRGAMGEKEKRYETQGTMYKVQSTKYEGKVMGDINYLPKLQVSTILENGQVRVTFEDNGTGIPEDIRDKILQPFFTTKKGTEGTGLGLSITHDIIKVHGGRLEIETQKNQMSRFVIILDGPV